MTRAKGKRQGKQQGKARQIVNQQQLPNMEVGSAVDYYYGQAVMSDSEILAYANWWAGLDYRNRPILESVGSQNGKRVMRVLVTLVQGGSELAGSHIGSNVTVQDSVRQARRSTAAARDRADSVAVTSREDMRAASSDLASEVASKLFG